MKKSHWYVVRNEKCNWSRINVGYLFRLLKRKGLTYVFLWEYFGIHIRTVYVLVKKCSPTHWEPVRKKLMELQKEEEIETRGQLIPFLRKKQSAKIILKKILKLRRNLIANVGKERADTRIYEKLSIT